MNALQKLVTRGATDQSVVLRAQNQISFVPQTSFQPSAAGTVVKYHRLNDPTAPSGGVSVALTSIAGLSVAHTDGAVHPIWDGYVRVDVPDAAFAKAVGVDQVLITAQATGVIFTGCMVQMTDDESIAKSTPQRY
jgi:hypothetical protein